MKLPADQEVKSIRCMSMFNDAGDQVFAQTRVVTGPPEAPDRAIDDDRGLVRRPPEEDPRCANCQSRMPADVGDWIPVILPRGPEASDRPPVILMACDRQCAVELEGRG